MKTTIPKIILCFLLSSLFFFPMQAQKSKADGPSKEETLQWLRTFEHFPTYWSKPKKPEADHYYLRFADEALTISVIPNEDFDAKREVQVLYKDILYIEDVESLKKSKDIFGDDYIAIPVKKHRKKLFSQKEEVNEFQKIEFLFAPQADRESLNRVLKALMHLAKLSGAQPYNEPF